MSCKGTTFLRDLCSPLLQEWIFSYFRSRKFIRPLADFAHMEKKIIGRKDIVSFPEFGLYDVPVKIDTGAYSSSMHCHSVEMQNSVLKVVFLDPSLHGYTGKAFEFSNFKRKTVKSSNGIAEERYFIPVVIRLFHTDYEAWFSLTVRTGLRNPVLLGRKLLNKRFLVDPSLTNRSRNFEQKNPL